MEEMYRQGMGVGEHRVSMPSLNMSPSGHFDVFTNLEEVPSLHCFRVLIQVLLHRYG